MTSIFCYRCGTSLPPGAQYCANCGADQFAASSIPRRSLIRPRVGRKIAGVCASLAQAYGWDVALIRVFAIIGLFFSGGLVAVAYLAGWIGIPEEPPEPPELPGTSIQI